MATNPTQTPTDQTPTTAAEALLDALADFLVEKFKLHLMAKYPELAAVFREPPKAPPGCILLRVPNLATDPIHRESFLGHHLPAHD